MRQGTDDAIHRFQARLIEIRGSVLPAHLRYTVWGVFGATIIPSFLLFGIAPYFSPLQSLLFGTGLASAITYKVANEIEGDRGLGGLLHLWLLEIRAWVQVRRTAAAAERAAQPYHYRTKTVKITDGGS